MTRVYIDCSDLVIDSANTGIRRVERNIIAAACIAGMNTGLTAFPVINLGPSFGLLQVELDPEKQSNNKVLKYFYTLYLRSLKPNRLRSLSKAAFPFLSNWFEFYWKKIRFAALPVLIIVLPALSILSLVYLLFRVRIKLSVGDVYFIPGSTWWSRDLSAQLTKIKAAGVSFGVLLHDFIPIDYPQFCNEKFNEDFSRFIPKILKSSDFVICISDYTKERLFYFLEKENIKNVKVFKNYSGFKLDLASNKNLIRPDLAFMKMVYISVGTIEPRKNHAYLLDAFDLAWQYGLNPVLCIIGKYGWKSEQLVERILTHPEYGKRLFWFSDLNDNELLYVYQHARACVYPSIVEGFGLPLIEALSLKCPVLASDIPVFHEVGGKYCHYFSLESPSFLYELIINVEKNGQLDNLDYLNDFKWPNWEESTTKLLKILASLNADNDS